MNNQLEFKQAAGERASRFVLVDEGARYFKEFAHDGPVWTREPARASKLGHEEARRVALRIRQQAGFMPEAIPAERIQLDTC